MAQAVIGRFFSFALLTNCMLSGFITSLTLSLYTMLVHCSGTPYYMSPEIFKNKPYNHKSDIWALGCVLYEMTTLNHAFDATSLNGLASKIVKGRYPPVNAKYSTPLKDLIGKMLSIAPADRPDLEKILTLSFIKKHIQNFLGDIMTREHSKLGEGTMVFKAAAVAIANSSSSSSGAADDSNFSNLSGNRDMLALQQQMEDLGLQSVVAKALSPPETERPTSAATAVKVAKEQASALRREEDRKQAVESALARLREEREDRQRKRQASIEAVRAAAAANSRGTPASAGNGLPPAVQSNNSNRTPGGMLSQAAVAPKPPRPSQVSHAQLAAAPVAVPSRKSAAAAAAAAAAVPRESGLRQKLGRGSANDDVSSSGVPPNDPTAAQLPPPGPTRVSSGGKRIDVAPVVAVSSSSSQSRAEAAERLAEEALQKRRDDAGRREAARSSKEKSRQQEEQDKLRQDKLDLDRKMAEHEKLREARRERERERISRASASADTAAVAVAAAVCSSSSNSSNYRDPFDKEAARERERQHRRSDSDSIGGSAHGSSASGDDGTSASTASSMSAREKVLARKRAKAAEEEAAQLEALRVAQADSAKHREQRQSRQRGQYVSSMDSNVIATAARSDTNTNNNGSKHSSSKSGMDSSEVAAKLGAAVGARRYSNSSDTSTATTAAAGSGVDGTTGGTHATSPRSVCSAAETDAGNSSDDSDTDELNGTGGWDRTGGSIDIPDLDGPDEGDEDIHKREEELIAELHMSTMRCEELRTTLQETKSIIGVPATASSSGVNGSARSSGKGSSGALESARPPAAAHHSTVKVVLEECEDEIDEDTFEGDEIDDDSSSNTSASANVAAVVVPVMNNAFAKDAERTADSSRYVVSSANNVRSDTPGGGRAPRYTEHNSYNNHSLVNEAKGGDDYPYNNSSHSSSKSKHSSSHSTAAAVPAVAASKHHHSSSSSVSISSGAKGTPRESGVSSAAVSKSPARSPPSQRGPSPTGRLGDRIRVLRQRCIEGLGQAVFERAYNYLRDLEEQETDADESFGEHSFSDGSSMAGLTDIIGAGKMHYYNLIDQLIFIENTHESTSPS
jgi:Protein kinase domain